jgi:Zn-dependent metalloprotease
VRRFNISTQAATLASTALLSLTLTAAAASASAPTDSAHSPQILPLDLSRLAAGQQVLNRLTKASAFQGFLGKTGASIQLKKEIRNHGFRTIKTQAYLNGLEVVGAEGFHHTTPLGESISGSLPAFDLDTRPTLSREQAEAIARGVTIGKSNVYGRAILKVLPSEDESSARLTYWVMVENQGPMDREDVVLDAHTGELIHKSTRHLTLAPVTVLSATSACQTLDSFGDIVDLDPSLCPTVIRRGTVLPAADDSAKRAGRNSQLVLEYFKTKHGRDSFDGRGAEVVSIVHIGKNFSNAFWSPDMKVMGYGDGDGVELKDFTFGVDVAGHEMTHGVVSHSANFLGFGQHGALNEAIADIFGKLIAQDGHWVLGKSLFINPNSPDAGIRNLENPRALNTGDFEVAADGTKKPIPYPAHYSERFKTQPGEACRDDLNDACWVHINSTIPGHAMFRMVSAIGEAKAEKIIYVALTQYLNARAKFIDARNAMISVCGNLYDSQTCSKVQRAWDDVGVL